MAEIKKPFLLLTIFFLGVVSLLAGGKFPYLFFYLTALIFFIPWLSLRRSLKKLTGSLEVSSLYSEVGGLLTVKYKVNNSPKGRFPYLELTNIIGDSFQAPEEEKIIGIDPGETVVMQREVRCNRRGKYDLKSFLVKTGDPFGFFNLARALATGEEIKVYPRLKFYPDITLLARQHFGGLTAEDKQFENYSQVSDLREWQDGDSIKRIHWKQSARHDRIVVKNFERKGDASLHIFLDMHDKNYRHDSEHRLEDLAVEAAASFIYFSLKDNVSVQVFSEPIPARSLRGRHLREYREIMDSIIGLAPRGKQVFSEYVHNQSYYLAAASSLFLITPSLSLADAAVFLRLKQKGYYPVLFYLALPGLEPKEAAILDKVKEAGIKVHVLRAAEERKDAG